MYACVPIFSKTETQGYASSNILFKTVSFLSCSRDTRNINLSLFFSIFSSSSLVTAGKNRGVLVLLLLLPFYMYLRRFFLVLRTHIHSTRQRLLYMEEVFHSWPMDILLRQPTRGRGKTPKSKKIRLVWAFRQELRLQ